MNKLFAAAALAALAASPALAGEIRISTAGKSPAQIESEVRSAAWKHCRAVNHGLNLKLEAMSACVEKTVSATLARVESPQRLAAR